MDFLINFGYSLLGQLQSPTLGFLIGGMLLAGFGSKLTIPNAVYQFIVFMLLMKIGLKGGIEIKQAELGEMFLPALIASTVGIVIVILGSFIFSLIPSIKREDGIATSGIFGAVSASTLAAAIILLEEQNINYEAWAPALYPFMDIPALILAIVIANLHMKKKDGSNENKTDVKGIIKESLRSSALSAMLLGLALGLFSTPDRVLESFYEPLFRGFLSVLMLVMGMEAYSRINELRKVAQWYVIYAFFAPIIHGLIAFGLGYIAHVTVGFSPGGVVILAIMAASSSDISGPPTLRAAIPTANPSAYVGSSTSIGTPVAIAICIPLFVELSKSLFNLN